MPGIVSQDQRRGQDGQDERGVLADALIFLSLASLADARRHCGNEDES